MILAQRKVKSNLPGIDMRICCLIAVHADQSLFERCIKRPGQYGRAALYRQRLSARFCAVEPKPWCCLAQRVRTVMKFIRADRRICVLRVTKPC